MGIGSSGTFVSSSALLSAARFTGHILMVAQLVLVHLTPDNVLAWHLLQASRARNSLQKGNKIVTVSSRVHKSDGYILYAAKILDK